MSSWLKKIPNFSHQNRKGSVTIEFIYIIPLFFALGLIVWQFVIAGMAVLETESAVANAVRVASTTGNVEKAKAEGLASFNGSSAYRMPNFDVSIQGDHAVAQAQTQIDVIFAPLPPFTYSKTAEAPVIK